MKQYAEKNTAATPRIVANKSDKKEKDLEKQVRDLGERIQEQDQLIHRMHRDIVRLRTSINEVASRIK
jgi:predicted RNase H-like nuclease (RuvC/YqgF family)